LSHPVPPADQPPYGSYPPPGNYPSGYQPAPGYQSHQYPQQYGTPPGPAYPQYQAYPPHHAPQPAPQFVIQNNVSAAAFAGGYARRKRQSVGVHILLFLFTAGLGNILYAWYVIDWNSKRGL